jgi:malate synthase
MSTFASIAIPQGVEVLGPVPEQYAEILTSPALAFLAKLARRFERTRQALLAQRATRQREISAGQLPDFLEETRSIREGNWQVAPIPAGLEDRRVEITGPVDRKMIINALNSGANVFMADFEDSTTPTWDNLLQGQINLRDAVRGTITYESPDGKSYALRPDPAILFVRPRGWHLPERHVLVDGAPISGSLFDFGLYIFHNGAALRERGKWPCFYLPKLESHHEARLWNDVLTFAEQELGLPYGSIRATVLIETILAAFEMDEILYELRDHSLGLNCGRWDYIFSFIKKLRDRPDRVLPDRSLVTMERHFLSSYVNLLIQTCHKRGAHAMGGMAAQIPIKNDPAANEAALAKVRQDKLREVRAGHDGTWVAHPGLVPMAKEIFEAGFSGPNQLHVRREEVKVKADDLLRVPEGPITEAGLRWNIDVALQYLAAWLGGLGCVPIYDLMEDAATAEISRAQVWQWVRHGATTDTGKAITPTLVRETIAAQADQLRGRPHLESAARLLERLVLGEEFTEFMPLAAYEAI